MKVASLVVGFCFFVGERSSTSCADDRELTGCWFSRCVNRMMVHPSDARAETDALSRRELKEWEEDRANVLGTSSACARREGARRSGVCTGGRVLGAGRLRLSAVATPHSAPHAKRKSHTRPDRRQLRDGLRHPLCRHGHVRSRDRTSGLCTSLSSTARHVHAQRETRVQTGVRSCLHSSVLFLPDLLPGVQRVLAQCRQREAATFRSCDATQRPARQKKVPHQTRQKTAA